MGTISYYVGMYVGMDRIKNSIVRDYSSDNHKVLYASIKFGACYLACEGTKKDGNKIKYALIVKYSYNKHTGMLSIKAMDETEHPYYYNTTKKLLSLLDYPENIHALQWRNTVLFNFKHTPEDFKPVTVKEKEYNAKLNKWEYVPKNIRLHKSLYAIAEKQDFLYKEGK